MSTQPIDYAAILANMEAKKQALESAIASLRAALAMGALGAPTDVLDVSSPAGASGGVSGFYGTEVPAGAFLGKSIPDAARLYLEIVKKKQTSREIAEALLKGGMESTSNNFAGIVHAVLDRARKSGNTNIVKIGSQWGLAGWYPKGILNSVATTSTPKKKGKKAKKAKKNTTEESAAAAGASATPAAPLLLPPAKIKAIDRALAFVKSKPEADLNDVATHIGMGVKGARLTLGKLVKEGKLRMSAPGTYTAIPFAASAAN